MKRLGLIILFIFTFSFSVFANENYEELCDLIPGNKFEGSVYAPSNSSSPLQFGPTYGDDWTSKTKVTSPKWFKYGNDYYLVLETESDQYTDDNDKKLGVYAITEYVKDEIAVVKWNSNYEAYYFNEDGICSSAITNEKGNKVLFNSDGTVKSGYTPEINIEQCNLDVYESDDFDGTKGVLDKDSNQKLYNGYWILDKGNDKYDLYNANSSGSSSTVSGATNKSAYELYTIINNKNYTQKASTSSNNATTNTSNITTNTNATGNKDIIKNVNNTLWASEGLNKNDYSVKVVNGSLQLILNNGYKFVKEGTYYIGDETVLTIDTNGKQIAWKTGNKGNYTDISQLKTYCIHIGETAYWITK